MKDTVRLRLYCDNIGCIFESRTVCVMEQHVFEKHKNDLLWAFIRTRWVKEDSDEGMPDGGGR